MRQANESRLKMVNATPSQIAFLHIPKTAGLSVIDAFRTRLGPDDCVAFSSEISHETFRGRRFVSGHVYRKDIKLDAFIFTFLRDPVAQIASHLMWVDHYNMPQYVHEAAHLPHSIKTAIGRLGETHLDDARSLEQFLRWLPADSDLRMVNVQSELLVFARGQVTPLDERAFAQAAVESALSLDFVGIAERLAFSLNQLFYRLGLDPVSAVNHLNRSPADRIVDPYDPKIRSVLTKFVGADIRLYDRMSTHLGAI